MKYINPSKITDFDRSVEDKELFFLFCISVVGKNSEVQARKINEMFSGTSHPSMKCVPMNEEAVKPLMTMREAADLVFQWRQKRYSPFAIFRKLQDENLLASFLTYHGIGQYTRITKCLKQVLSKRGGLHFTAGTTHKDLVKYHGVGPKTARFFMLHAYTNQRVAVLDTHILRWLSRKVDSSVLSSLISVPESTPQIEEVYEFWETLFLGFAYKANKTPAIFDLEIWNHK